METDPLIGRTIGNWHILADIGRGSSSRVWQARELTSDYPVALKLLRRSESNDDIQMQRFAREARILTALRHPHIIHLYSYDLAADEPYIVMEYLPGGTLKSRLRAMRQRGTRLPLAESVRIALAIASALGYAHRHALVHRDVKPGNILFDTENRPILSDFGLIKELESNVHTTMTGVMVGTPAYMAPEQGMGKPGDARSDVYALGVVLYELVTGTTPFRADKPLAIVLKHINEPPPDPREQNPDLPASLRQIILTALEKEPQKRYRDGVALEHALWEAAQAAQAPGEWAHGLTWTPTPEAQEAQSADSTLHLFPDATPPAPLSSDDSLSLTLPVPGKKSADPAPALTPSGLLPDTDPEVSPAAPEPPIRRHKRRRSSRNGWDWRTWTLTLSLLALLVLLALSRRGAWNNQPLPGPTASSLTLPAGTAEEVDCPVSVTLVQAFAWAESALDVAPGTTFPLNQVVRNDSACTLPAGLKLAWQEGEPPVQADAITLLRPLAPQEAITLTTLLRAPATPGSWKMAWAIESADGTPLTPPWSVTLTVSSP
jgi:serine/threonine protein kinase